MISVRRLLPAEWALAFRSSRNCATWTRRNSCAAPAVRRMAAELVGAYLNDALVGVMGMRPVHTLARGPHLHVDDLVVDAAVRGSGAGHALMAYAEADARAREMSAVFLDARPDAIPFYEKENYVRHPAPSMKKSLAP